MPDESIFEDKSEETAEEGIQYVEEDGSPEEADHSPSDYMPPLVTAADLLDEPDPLAAIPEEAPDDETPPDDSAPPFIIERNKWGPGAHGMYVRDGRSIGQWLDQEHHDLDGEEVRHLLLDMGLEPQLAFWFGKQRTGRIEADASIGGTPLVRAALAQEAERVKTKKQIQEAFVKAQKKKS